MATSFTTAFAPKRLIKTNPALASMANSMVAPTTNAFKSIGDATAGATPPKEFDLASFMQAVPTASNSAGTSTAGSGASGIDYSFLNAPVNATGGTSNNTATGGTSSSSNSSNNTNDFNNLAPSDMALLNTILGGQKLPANFYVPRNVQAVANNYNNNSDITNNSNISNNTNSQAQTSSNVNWNPSNASTNASTPSSQFNVANGGSIMNAGNSTNVIRTGNAPTGPLTAPALATPTITGGSNVAGSGGSYNTATSTLNGDVNKVTTNTSTAGGNSYTGINTNPSSQDVVQAANNANGATALNQFGQLGGANMISTGNVALTPNSNIVATDQQLTGGNAPVSSQYNDSSITPPQNVDGDLVNSILQNQVVANSSPVQNQTQNANIGNFTGTYKGNVTNNIDQNQQATQDAPVNTTVTGAQGPTTVTSTPEQNQNQTANMGDFSGDFYGDVDNTINQNQDATQNAPVNTTVTAPPAPPAPTMPPPPATLPPVEDVLAAVESTPEQNQEQDAAMGDFSGDFYGDVNNEINQTQNATQNAPVNTQVTVPPPPPPQTGAPPPSELDGIDDIINGTTPPTQTEAPPANTTQPPVVQQPPPAQPVTQPYQPPPGETPIGIPPVAQTQPIQNHMTQDEARDFADNVLGVSSQMTPLQKIMFVADRTGANLQEPVWTSDASRQYVAGLLKTQLEKGGDMSWAQTPKMKEYLNNVVGVDPTNPEQMKLSLSQVYRMQ